MGAKKKITVLGAGIVGVCSALRLQRDEGHEVTLIDRDEPGLGSSFGNAGALSPANCIPMALPGMVRQVPGWLFDSNGPLAIRRSYALRVAPWLLKWVASAKPEVVRDASKALAALHVGTLDAYREMLSPEQFNDVIRPTGQIYLWRRRPTGPLQDLVQSLRQANGHKTEELNAEELRQIVPELSRDITAGLLFPNNGHTRNPHRLVQTLVGNFVAAGGRLLRDNVTGIGFGPEGPNRLLTRIGELPFDTLVIAAGAYSAPFTREVGVTVPLEAERGYHLMVKDPNVTLRMTLNFGDHKMAATSMETGLRLAGTVEFAGLEAAPDWRRSEILLEHARRVFPGLTGSGTTVWMGMRPGIPNSVPVIGRSPRHANVFLAFGHGHSGMSGGPGTGKLIADLVAGRAPFIDPAPYSPQRFARAA
jgi:D-amino-acid dehydrogenase